MEIQEGKENEKQFMFLRESVYNYQPIVVSPTDNELIYEVVKSFKGDIPRGMQLQVNSTKDVVSHEEAIRIIALRVGSVMNFVDNVKETNV